MGDQYLRFLELAKWRKSTIVPQLKLIRLLGAFLRTVIVLLICASLVTSFLILDMGFTSGCPQSWFDPNVKAVDRLLTNSVASHESYATVKARLSNLQSLIPSIEQHSLDISGKAPPGPLSSFQLNPSELVKDALRGGPGLVNVRKYDPNAGLSIAYWTYESGRINGDIFVVFDRNKAVYVANYVWTSNLI